jgi:glyoxylase-like metal-dependent hydrolase (beta-lactamase superfamily II)
MARLAERHPGNAPGDWYVDDRCIACDVARQHAPDLISSVGDGKSIVTRQPATPGEEMMLWRAALACPTRSVGTASRRHAPPGVFPMQVAPGVFLCGHNDPRSFGAHAWFVPQARDPFMVDAPHWNGTLVQAIEDAGGIDHVLLTHRDDIADAQRYAGHFGARVWIHDADRDAAPFATDIITTTSEITIFPGTIAFAMPGHTRGSVLYLHDQRHLFSGDTLAWTRQTADVRSIETIWHSRREHHRSLGRLARSAHRFEHIFPGHGDWTPAPVTDMSARLARLADQVRSQSQEAEPT